ncbi:hypothetical protein PU629_04250 [Pullulanibacillus sp. KACC 23026]|uniref:esterase/lipase family protein n=1 Tax=Pullulanibacillus sp. KACC 23026 TaxID=3028315 RepID=UPI0023B1CF1F|nr:alpha/beta fold hydrolase [Pullulanibacillus sp. KACC 23026]WEG13587.1 hypothetical protein PU629_04250 [Pullulanibacillus sp. KACC 23026]
MVDKGMSITRYKELSASFKFNKKGLCLSLFLIAIILSIYPSSAAQAESVPTGKAPSFLVKQGTPPKGANNPRCVLTPSHPEPIILVPGTLETMDFTWFSLSPELAKRGYCVYALNYGWFMGQPSAGSITASARELRQFIKEVMTYTRAKKVSIIGHSQGGMMPRYFIKFLKGDRVVDDLIGLVPSNHGTALSNWFNPIASIGTCPSCEEQATGSPFYQKLNQGDETPGKVSYTVISTQYDEVVVPYTSAFLSDAPGKSAVQGKKGRTTNIKLQTYIPSDLTGHVTISFNKNAYPFILDALSHPGPADPRRVMTALKGH